MRKNGASGARHSLVFLLLASFLSCGNPAKPQETLSDYEQGTAIVKEVWGKMGRGFDVSWPQFTKSIESYNEKMTADIAAAGFQNIRLRTDRAATEEDLFRYLDVHVADCLKYNLIPIIAYGAGYVEESENPYDHIEEVVDWWTTVAEHYKDQPKELMFNLFIEVSGRLEKNENDERTSDIINTFYAALVPAIRKISPQRIIIMSPVNASNPLYLKDVVIPPSAYPYAMAEWHFYAAGPQRSGRSEWTTGGPEDRQRIADKINAAIEWQEATGLKTWVGAWMAGNFNLASAGYKRNDYTVAEQVKFATYIVNELDKAKVPWSLNEIRKYYDAESNRWYAKHPVPIGQDKQGGGHRPVLDVIRNTQAAVLYEDQAYEGESRSFEAGDYSSLEDFSHRSSSLMVPWGFEVRLYPREDFLGGKTVYTETQEDLSSGGENAASMKVIFLGY